MSQFINECEDGHDLIGFSSEKCPICTLKVYHASRDEKISNEMDGIKKTFESVKNNIHSFFEKVNIQGVKTGFKDHTGKKIMVGDKCLMDSGHAHDHDDKNWIGIIILNNNDYWFRYDCNGDEVMLSVVHSDLEVI